MFGFLGLLGAVMTSTVVDHADDDHPDVERAGGGTDLLDDPGGANDRAAGMPMSDDFMDAREVDEALAGDGVLASHGGNDTLKGGRGR